MCRCYVENYVYGLFHRLKEAVPAVPVQYSRSFFLGEPDQRRFPDHMILRNESEQTRVGQVDAVVGSHPVVIFGEETMLCRFSVDIKRIILYFRLFAFVHNEGISQ